MEYSITAQQQYNTQHITYNIQHIKINIQNQHITIIFNNRNHNHNKQPITIISSYQHINFTINNNYKNNIKYMDLIINHCHHATSNTVKQYQVSLSVSSSMLTQQQYTQLQIVSLKLASILIDNFQCEQPNIGQSWRNKVALHTPTIKSFPAQQQIILFQCIFLQLISKVARKKLAPQFCEVNRLWAEALQIIRQSYPKASLKEMSAVIATRQNQKKMFFVLVTYLYQYVLIFVNACRDLKVSIAQFFLHQFQTCLINDTLFYEHSMKTLKSMLNRQLFKSFKKVCMEMSRYEYDQELKQAFMRTHNLMEDMEGLSAKEFMVKLYTVIGQLGKLKCNNHSQCNTITINNSISDNNNNNNNNNSNNVDSNNADSNFNDSNAKHYPSIDNIMKQFENRSKTATNNKKNNDNDNNDEISTTSNNNNQTDTKPKNKNKKKNKKKNKNKQVHDATQHTPSILQSTPTSTTLSSQLSVQQQYQPLTNTMIKQQQNSNNGNGNSNSNINTSSSSQISIDDYLMGLSILREGRSACYTDEAWLDKLAKLKYNNNNSIREA